MPRSTPFDRWAGRGMSRPRWRRTSANTWERTIEPSAGYMRMTRVVGDVYVATVYCERFELKLGRLTEDALPRAKRRATALLARLRSALQGVGEDECPF